jgi:alpha-beta hydrolase superfamily lysophospholipase
MRVTGTVAARDSSSVRDALEEESVTITTLPPAGGIQPFQDVPGVRHRFAEVRGVRLHAAEAVAGEPVVLLHSFPQHWYAWWHVIPQLAGQYRLICPDWRGFG